MDRRQVLTGIIGLGAIGSLSPREALAAGDSPAARPLVRSGAVTSKMDGQVIEFLDVESRDGNAVTITHNGVTVRNCRIRHTGGNGIFASGCNGLGLHDLEIEHIGAPSKGAGPDEDRNNINVFNCPGVVITRIRATRGAANIYVQQSPAARLSQLSLFDARGPMPRGQNVQLNASPDTILEDFSAENGPASWTEDNISLFRSDRCIVRRGLVSYNNSPTGFGVMIEGGFDCLVEDVDVVQQGNGAFAAVTQEEAGAGNCHFVRCRTRDTYNAKRDGRDAPTSNSLSIYTEISDGAEKHTVRDCAFFNLANPGNLIWDLDAVKSGWSFNARNFTPRSRIILQFPWSAAETGSSKKAMRI